ncbi:MAG TPA: tripartite tricarboxylate transporter substrate binding protein [Alphaproteobacteria bacterium]
MSRRRWFGLVLLAAIVASSGARAQSYPTGSIRLLVAFTPGGPSDVLARIVGERMSLRLGQPVVIENRPGAGGNVAAEIVANAPADGYTLLNANNSILATNAALYRHLPFDPLRDFAPISLIGSQPNILVVHPSLPVHSVADLVALAKAEPGKLNYGSSGNGTAAHLAAELFRLRAGIDIVHVAYRGAAPALTDLTSGRLQLMFATSASVLQFIESGTLRAVAVTTAERSAAVPDLPTVAESGFPDFEATTWHGLVAPAKTSPAVVEKLNQTVVAVLRETDIRQRLAGLGVEIVGDSPAEFGAYIRSESAKWAAVVKSAGIQIE